MKRWHTFNTMKGDFIVDLNSISGYRGEGSYTTIFLPGGRVEVLSHWRLVQKFVRPTQDYNVGDD